MSSLSTTGPTRRFAVAVWALSCAAGLAWLASYGLQAEPPAAPSSTWPQALPLELATDRPTLVMTAHPQCPCTRASLQELAKLRAQAGDRLRLTVLFAELEGVPLRSDLWRRATAIPGVQALADPEGRMAERLGAVTSGQTYVYDPAGKLLYSGGLTASRGHAGDNSGRSAVLAIARGARAGAVGPPAFGCALRSQARSLER